MFVHVVQVQVDLVRTLNEDPSLSAHMRYADVLHRSRCSISLFPFAGSGALVLRSDHVWKAGVASGGGHKGK